MYKRQVFDAVDDGELVNEGRRLITWLAEDDRYLAIREQRRAPMGLSDDQVAFSFAVAAGQVMLKTKGQYPAPMAALESMQQGLNRPLDEGLAIERECARQIVGSEIAGNMIRIFFMQTRVSQDAGGPTGAEPHPVNRVGVLGACLLYTSPSPRD